MSTKKLVCAFVGVLAIASGVSADECPEGTIKLEGGDHDGVCCEPGMLKDNCDCMGAKVDMCGNCGGPVEEKDIGDFGTQSTCEHSRDCLAGMYCQRRNTWYLGEDNGGHVGTDHAHKDDPRLRRHRSRNLLFTRGSGGQWRNNAADGTERIETNPQRNPGAGGHQSGDVWGHYGVCACMHDDGRGSSKDWDKKPRPSYDYPLGSVYPEAEEEWLVDEPADQDMILDDLDN